MKQPFYEDVKENLHKFVLFQPIKIVVKFIARQKNYCM